MQRRLIFLTQLIVHFYLYLGANAYAQATLHDIKPPVDYPRNMIGIYILYALGMIVVIIAIIYLIHYLNKKQTKTSSIPIKTPYEEAMERLESLNKKSWPEKGLIKEYYTELADIIRVYIERHLGLRAPEMTTEEFLIHLQMSEKLQPDHKTLLTGFMECCDLVKFAKFAPTPQQHFDSYVAAQKFIQESYTQSQQQDQKEGET